MGRQDGAADGARSVEGSQYTGRAGPAEAHEAVVTEVESLLTRKTLAQFLGWSIRSVDYALASAPEEAGSIPYVELPSRGRKRQVRFVPDTIRQWLEAGCPPAADFERMKRAADQRQRRR